MRVLIAPDRVGSRDGVDMAVLIGRAWREAGAQVAAVGLADAGLDWRRAHDVLSQDDPALYVSLLGTEPQAMIGLLVELGAKALPAHWAAADPVPDLDLSPVSARLHARALIGLCEAEAGDHVLTGPNGLVGQRGELALKDRLALDRGLENWSRAVCAASSRVMPELELDPAVTAGRAPGSGAGGGAGMVVQALGGRVRPGVDVLAELAQLERSVAAADLVVTACDNFDAHYWGTAVTKHVVAAAVRNETPAVLIARTNGTNEMDQRNVDIQAVHAIGEADDVTSACRGFAASWVW